MKAERKRSGSQNNSRDSTASQRRRSGSRPSSLKDKEAIFNAVFNAPRPEEVAAERRAENGGEKGRHHEEVDEVPEEDEEEEAPEEDFNYDEDEFEDYDDDDFEEEPEEEEENDVKMDSGNYDDRRSMMERARMEQEMREVKQAMARENTARGTRARRRAGDDGDDVARGDVRSDDSGKGTPKDEEGNDEESTAKRKRLKVGSYSWCRNWDTFEVY